MSTEPEHATSPLIRAALDLTAGLAAEDRYRRLIDSVFLALPCDGAHLMRLEPDGLRSVAARGLQDRALAFDADRYPIMSAFLESSGPVRRVGAVSLLEAYAGVPEAEQRDGVIMGIRLTVEGRPVGLLVAAARDPHAFDAISDELLVGYAALAAAALRTADLIEALHGAAEQRKRIADDLLRDANERVQGPLLGSGPGVTELRRAIQRFAPVDDALLVRAPPGPGAEAVARALHAASPRGDSAFIYVNCALHPSSQAETLFGRGLGDPEDDRGGFEHAKFELAAGGTVFLEGVDRLATATQNLLAGVLERAAAVRRQGGRPVPDARVVASVTADTGTGLSEGLSAVLGASELVLPPLSQRIEDLPRLAEHYLHHHANRLGKTVERITDATLQRMREHHWPGDLRELSSVLEQAVARATGPVVEIEAAELASHVRFGSYRLVERLGGGGMGEIWLAEHGLLARAAAVKVIRPEMLGGEASAAIRQRFEREARATADLRSPHTVELYDFGLTDDGAFYYVMEKLEGLDLESLVRDHGPISWPRVVFLLRQACRSLSEAHSAGLVHRDVKPANLFSCHLGPDYDFLKVLDFGMVRGQAADEVKLTSDQVVQGTPAFLAPEMALDPDSVDGRADLYALGCVAYWLLTGRLVFEARMAMQMVLKHVNEAPVAASTHLDDPIPSALDELVLRCLAKDPADRPRNADVLWRELGALENPEPWTPEHATLWWKARGY